MAKIEDDAPGVGVVDEMLPIPVVRCPFWLRRTSTSFHPFQPGISIGSQDAVSRDCGTFVSTHIIQRSEDAMEVASEVRKVKST